MAMFTGFKPSGMQKIANRLGYSGDMVNFDNYLQQNPDKQRQMIVFEEAARKMAEGGMITSLPTAPIPTQQISTDSGIQQTYCGQRLSHPDYHKEQR